MARDGAIEEGEEGDESDGELQNEFNKKLESEILFWINGVGGIKQVGEADVYVKHEHCEESLREIFKKLRFDSKKNPHVHHKVGEWKFVQKHLLPLLVFHHKDKKLAFLTMMLLVQLTQMPTQRISPKYKLDMFRHLHYYKYHALEPKVIETLVAHLSEILPKEQRTEKHDQMVELEIVLFK